MLLIGCDAECLKQKQCFGKLGGTGSLDTPCAVLATGRDLITAGQGCALSLEPLLAPPRPFIRAGLGLCTPPPHGLFASSEPLHSTVDVTAALSKASSLGPVEGKCKRSAHWDQPSMKLGNVRGCPGRARLRPSSGPTHGSGLPVREGIPVLER